MNLPVLYNLCQLCPVLKGIDYKDIQCVEDGLTLVKSNIDMKGVGKPMILKAVLQILLNIGPECENADRQSDELFGAGAKYNIDRFVDWLITKNMLPPFGIAFLYPKQFVTDSIVVSRVSATKFVQLAPVTEETGLFRENTNSLTIQTKQNCPTCYNGLGPSSMLVPNACITRVQNSHNFKLYKPECYGGREQLAFNVESEFKKTKMYPVPCEVVLSKESVDRGWSPTGRNMGAFDNYIDVFKPNEVTDPLRHVSSQNWYGSTLINPIVLLYESCLNKDTDCFVLNKYFFGNGSALQFGHMVHRMAKLLSTDKFFDNRLSDAKKNQGKLNEEDVMDDGFFAKNAIKNDCLSDITLLAMPGNTWNDENMENRYSLNAGRLFAQGEPGVIKGDGDNKWFMPGNVTVATPILLSKTVFSYRFRIVFESYRFMPFETPFEGKNGV